MKFKNFGIRLGESIATAGLTQAEVARRLKTSPSLVSRWRNEEILPGMLNCKKLSKMLGVTIEWLLTGENADDTSTIPDGTLKLLGKEEDSMFMIDLIEAQAEIIELQKENKILMEKLYGGEGKKLRARGKNGK
tara:strand:- start:9 stop:410 length:402 start_codon:yes stop_codon:yes gene_type:complete